MAILPLSQPSPSQREDAPSRILACSGLSAADLARIEEAIPADAVAGTRYDEHQMRMLDSER